MIFGDVVEVIGDGAADVLLRVVAQTLEQSQRGSGIAAQRGELAALLDDLVVTARPKE